MIVTRKHHFSINTKISSEVAMDPVKHPTTFKLVKRMIKSLVTSEVHRVVLFDDATETESPRAALSSVFIASKLSGGVVTQTLPF